MTSMALARAFMTGLVAQTSAQPRWEGVQNAFRNSLDRGGGEYSALVTAGYFVAGLFIVSLIAYLLVRRSQRSESDRGAKPPIRFFGSVLAQLGVSWPDRVLLQFVARSSDLPQPTIMLLHSDLMDRYSQEWVDSLGLPFLRNQVRRRLDLIRAKVFA